MINVELNEAIRKVRKLGKQFEESNDNAIYTHYKEIAANFSDHKDELMNEFLYGN